MKIKHGIFSGFVIIVLAAIFILAGCPTDPEPPSGPTLKELLGKYIGPSPQIWDHDDDAGGREQDTEDTLVYYLDPAQFAAFKAALDAGGELYSRCRQRRRRLVAYYGRRKPSKDLCKVG